MRILATDGIDASAVKKFTEDGFEVVEKFYEPEELGEALKDFDVVIVRSATKLKDHAILDTAKTGNLKMIIRAGVGVDNIDVKYAESIGLKVRNTPKAAQNPVAELALGHMLSVARNISISGYTMRNGQWEKKAYSKGVELKGKTLGIIGFGRIGQRLCQIAQGVGMNVVAFDIFHVPGIEEKMNMKYVEMDELLAAADFISVHAPAADGGAIINKETIAKMKDGVIVVNTSRGQNVDEEALLEGLNSGKIMGAGLDVYLTEKISNPELINHPHVSCTPHIGSGTKEAQKAIGGELIEIVEAFAKEL